MATENNSDEAGASRVAGFRISTGLVVRGGTGDYALSSDFGELPQVYGAPAIFSIARDPRTLFTYWSINWSEVFAKGEPVDRQVYLRVKKADGTDESESAVEPMMGSHYAVVAQPRGSYQVEIGYYDAADGWRAVAMSETVEMPPEGAVDDVDVDLATVPLHLSFQRMIDLFRSSKGNSLTAIISRLQKRAVLDDESDALTAEEWEILQAMDIPVSEIDEARRAFAGGVDDKRLRKRTEAILGFGATSPAEGFGGSSWSSSAS
jgi:hypothetical protein